MFIQYNVQWKPIANKYRKGTMKSTLHSTQAALIAVRRFKHYLLASSKGSERESEIALQRILHITLYCLTILCFTHRTTRARALLCVSVCVQIHVLPNSLHFSEVQSDRAPLANLISDSELLCIFFNCIACYAI